MAAEVLTSRWTPIVIRELISGSSRFNELRRGMPRMSQSLLSSRLNELVRHGIITKEKSGNGGTRYILTEAGEALRPIIELMGLWGSRYLMHNLTEAEEDPELLFWDISRRVDAARMPVVGNCTKPYVTYFEVSGIKKGQRLWWLMRDGDDADLCYRDPGHDIDLTVNASLSTLIAVWIGTQSLSGALERGTLVLDGNRADKSGFEQWFSLSAFANETTRKTLSVSGKTTGDLVTDLWPDGGTA